MDLAEETKLMNTKADSSSFDKLVFETDGGSVQMSKTTGGLSKTKQTSSLPSIAPASKTVPIGPGKMTKVTTKFQKKNKKCVFNKQNATLEVVAGYFVYFVVRSHYYL